MLRQAWESEDLSPKPTRTEAPRDQSPIPSTPHITTEVPISPPVQTSAIKGAELPKGTLPEMGQVVAPEVMPPVIAEVQKPSHDLGRGGPAHQEMQKRLKRVAQELGFIAKIEDPTSDQPRRSVDLLLERGDIVVACEFPFTNSIQREVGNIAKCLKAGFSRVAVVSEDRNHLDKIHAAASASLGSDVADRVGYFHPDEFIVQLKELAAHAPTTDPETEVRRGYKTRHVPAQLTQDELKARNENAIKAIAAVMRQKTK